VVRGFIPVGARSGPAFDLKKQGPAAQASGDESPHHIDSVSLNRGVLVGRGGHQATDP
jgi:hypothetical protein